MIIESLAQIGSYPLLPRLTRAVEWLRQQDFSTLADGKIEVDGSRIFALVQSYQSKPLAQGRWEAHRRYIDVQYVVSGSELMGWAPLESLTIQDPYRSDKDVVFFQAPAAGSPGCMVHVPAGFLAFFFPQDAHLPAIAVGEPAAVRKIVMKVEVEG